MLKNFLKDNKLKQWPSKSLDRQEATNFLASHVESGKKYSEKEITILLDNLHLFGDPAFLRRELCDRGLLRRDKYGKEYWKVIPAPSLDKSNP